MSFEEKTEAPSGKRRQDAREEGQVARSQEVNAGLVLLTGLYLVRSVGPNIFNSFKDIAVDSFTNFPKNELQIVDVSAMLAQILLQMAKAVAPLILGIVVVGTLANIAQVGLKWSWKPLTFKGERLNPLPGFARMFSKTAAVELAKSLAKVFVIGFIVFGYLWSQYPQIATLAGCDFFTTLSRISEIAWGVFLRGTVGLLLIAAFDYAYQRYTHEKRLKMSKQEVKDEAKSQEGDPKVKGEIRKKMLQAIMRRMMSEVPKADVVITNPTHFAIAIKYDSLRQEAPKVVAKGQDLIALRIRAIAEENNVPIVENKPLARSLYATVEIGQEIPADMYQAVAEVLAYVYKLSNRLLN